MPGIYGAEPVMTLILMWCDCRGVGCWACALGQPEDDTEDDEEVNSCTGDF
jgi:hypothetical protein